MQKISTTNKKKEGEGEKNKGLCITFRKRKIDYSTLYYASITVCVTHSLILHTHTLSLFTLVLRISASNPSLATATTTNQRRRHPQNKRRRQQECRSKGGSSCEPCRVCVRVCVCVSVCGYIDFSIKSLPRLVNWFFRSYIIHACILSVCMYGMFIRGICILFNLVFVVFRFCRWAATGSLRFKVIRGTIFLAATAAAITTTHNNNNK